MCQRFNCRVFHSFSTQILVRAYKHKRVHSQHTYTSMRSGKLQATLDKSSVEVALGGRIRLAQQNIQQAQALRCLTNKVGFIMTLPGLLAGKVFKCLENLVREVLAVLFLA